MKKVLSALLLFLLLFVTVGIVDAQAKDKESSELSEFDYEVFDKLKKKDYYEEQGYMVVDTINISGETFIYNDNVIEKKAVVVEMMTNNKDELSIVFTKAKDLAKDKEKEKIVSLEKLLKKDKVKYSEVYDFLNSNDLYDSNPEFLASVFYEEKLEDPNRITPTTTFYYWTVATGTFQDFNSFQTIEATYHKQAEYYRDLYSSYSGTCTQSNTKYYTYVQNNNTCNVYKNVYTGANKYVLNGSSATYYDHNDSESFVYQSFNNGIDDGTTPYATIYVIEDYLGREKMLIYSSSIETPYKISREVHHDRNTYNKISGQPLDLKYPTKSDLPSDWEEKTLGNYFHILAHNNGNTKHTKEITYYNSTTGATTPGSYELVYTSNEVIEYDDIVSFTFNFGIKENYNEGGAPISDGHWVMDVYPYLVWGNSISDSSKAYERFCWDKDAGNLISFNDHKNLRGSSLLSAYYADESQYTGTVIPSAVINKEAPFFD